VIFPSPTIFPVDNATELNVTLAILLAAVNSRLGTNGTTLIGSVVFDSVLRQTNVTVLVPNETYASTTAATLQPTATNYSQVFTSLTSYYALTDFAFLLDPLQLPFLLSGDADVNINNSAASQLRSLLEAEARSILRYNYTFTAPPVWTTNVSDGGNLSSWKLLIPASFQNSTTIALLSTALHATAYALGASLYASDVYVNISTSLLPQLPISNATAMQEIRRLVQQEVERVLAFTPSGVDPLTLNATSATYVAKVYVPGSFSPSTNATTQALLDNATWSLLVEYVKAFYPVAHVITVDETKLPSSDTAAVAAIVALLKEDVNRLIAGSSSSTYVGVGARPVVDVAAHTATFSVYVPLSYELAASSTGNVSATNNTISDALLANPYMTVQNFLYQYYLQSATMYHATFAALSLPLFNESLMEALRIAVGIDLATALNFTDVGANSTVRPIFATTSSTGITIGAPSGSNGAASSSVLVGPSDTVYFPLLLPPWLVNTTFANSTLANLTANGFPMFQALLQANMIASLNITVDRTLLPVNNATAMERLRQLLTVALRGVANSTDSSLSVMPAVTINGTAVTYEIVGPIGALAGIDIADLLKRFLDAATQRGNGTIATFLDSYYTTGLSVSLPYDVVPWSNDTTMNSVKANIVADVTSALSSIDTTADSVHVQSFVVAKDPNRTVTFYLRIPPAYVSTTAKTALTISALNRSSLPMTSSFLLQYFPKNLTVSLDGNALPWANASAMATVRAIVADYLASNVFMFDNVGTNSSVYNTTDGRVYFKVIVPPSFDNASTWANVSVRLSLTDIANLTSFLTGYYPANYAAIFADGILPTTNATAMEAIRKLLQLDIIDLLQYPSIGVENSATVTDNTTGITTLQFPLLIPPTFDNATTAQLLINATYFRVLAYLAVYYATPAPPTPVPAFIYTSAWPIAAMPSGNDTQMALLGEALFRDIVNSLKLSPEQVSVSTWQLSSDGQNAHWIVTLPTFADNATTGTILQDISNNYPIFQALLAELTQGNLVDIGGGASSVNEGCSRGCVIGVAAVGAIIVTAGVIGIVVMTSKKRRTATVIAPKFSSVMEEDEAMPSAADETPQRSRKARNPLEMA
jgi:hypothetical protein